MALMAASESWTHPLRLSISSAGADSPTAIAAASVSNSTCRGQGGGEGETAPSAGRKGGPRRVHPLEGRAYGRAGRKGR